MAASRVAIVTGASRGIGRATALALARSGYDLAVTARSGAHLESLAAEVKAGCDRRTVWRAADFADPAEPAALVADAMAAFGRIDLVVNNAGATKRGDFLALTDQDWADGFGLKLMGAVRLSRAAWPHLRATQGQIVNIAGTGGLTPSAEFTIGGGVNAAMMNLSKALADFGLADGIRVNCINPALIRTDRLEVRIRRYADEHKCSLDEATAELARAEHALRFGEADEVASIVVFLAAGGGSFINGARIEVDGGCTPGL